MKQIAEKITKVSWRTHWVDRFGTPILFTEMGNNHLCNTLDMLYRHAMQARQVAVNFSRGPKLVDETGEVKKRSEAGLIKNEYDMQFIHPAFPGLYAEAKHRGLLDTLSFPLWIE